MKLHVDLGTDNITVEMITIKAQCSYGANVWYVGTVLI